MYTEAGVATDVELSNNREELNLRIAQEGKDRSRLLAALLKELGTEDPTVCIFGCSWGYEMLPLLDLNCKIVGIELSKPRREYGKKTLKLAIYGSSEEVVAQVGTIDVLMSSHVLEHVPQVGTLLKRLQDLLQPRIQLHFTPCVEAMSTDASISRLVGREHPIGVTREFWLQHASIYKLHLTLSIEGQATDKAYGESVAVLRTTGY